MPARAVPTRCPAPDDARPGAARRRARCLAGLGIALALLAPGCRGDEGPSPADREPAAAAPRPEDVRAGAALYRTYCASCHGREGRGDGPAAAALARPPSDLTGLAARHGRPLPRARLAAFIDGRTDVPAHGPREMPVWGERLYAGERESARKEAVRRGSILLILDYLETIQEPPPPPPAPSARRPARTPAAG